MPSHVNPNKCYNLPPNKLLPAVTAELPEDFLNRLADFCILTLKLDEDQAFSFRSRFQYHTGEDATYSAKKALHHSLGLVYQRLSTTKDENEKKGIVLKLHEGIPNCTEGFHDRANSILMEESRDSLDGLLTQMRTDLILRATSQRTDEVHAHTRFFTIAATSGYGVRAIHLDDGYHGALSDNTIREAIQTVFNEHYQPFSILHTCLSMMKTELNGLGYVGERRMNTAYTLCPLEGTEFKRSSNLLYVKTQDEHLEYKTYNDGIYHSGKIPLTEFKLDKPLNFMTEKDRIIQKLWERGDTRTGYDLGEITSFLGYLQKILGQKPLDLSAYTLLDEEGHFIDLNWETINKALFSIFMEQEYFTFNAEQAKLVGLFLSKPENIKDQDIEDLYSNRLLPNPSSLLDLISLSSIKDPELNWRLMQKMIDRQLASQRLSVFKELIHKIHNQEALCHKLYASNQALIGGILKKLKKRTLFTKYRSLVDALYYDECTQASLYLSFFHLPGALTQDEKFQLLSQLGPDHNNALMFALRYRPQLISPLIKAMSDLTKEQKQVLLTSRNNDNEHALLIAVCYSPSAVPRILELINDFPMKSKSEILTHHTHNNYNVLMSAAQYQPATFGPLIRAMNDLPEEKKIRMATQTTLNGFNCLHLAARLNKPVLVPLLTLINEFPMETKIRILSRPTGDQYHAFMTAIRYSPEELGPFIDMINTFGIEEKYKLLSKINNSGFNVLMVAFRHQASAIVPLLDMMSDLSLQAKINLLSQNSTWGMNALILAVRNKRDTAQLLNMINLFPREAKTVLFTQTCSHGFNALMMATRYEPNAVVPILDSIKELPNEILLRILSQTNEKGSTPLVLASLYHCETAVSPLLDLFDTLPSNQLAPLLKPLKSLISPETKATIGADRIELEMKLQLLHLKSKVAYFKTKKGRSEDYKAAHLAAKTLYTALSFDFNTYLNSAKSEHNLSTLKNNWEMSIEQSRAVLSKHRGMANLLANLLFCATGVGLLLLTARAGLSCIKNTQKQRFFLPLIKTDSEILLNKLSTAVILHL